MGKIMFIAPCQEMLDIGQRVISELELTDHVQCDIGWLEQGVDIARRAEARGVDVIVTRGGTAELIVKAGIQVPIIEIPVTVQDLAEALLTAKQLTGNENPKIAVVAFKNMMETIGVFERVMDIRLHVFPLISEDDIEAKVKLAIDAGADIVIGGIKTTELAAKRGKCIYLLASGDDSYRDAFLHAMKVSYARTLEKERMEKFRILVDNSVQGIIGIDTNGMISVFNNAAERLLNLTAQQVIGRNVDSVMPEIGLETRKNQIRPTFGELVKINNKKFMANIMPIDINGSISEIMVTIEDIGKIVEQEATIRSEIYSKGLTAQYCFEDIRGSSPQIQEVKRVAREYAGIDATVLITGASGTGKELFAQSIHQASRRRQGPFVAVNCGAIAPSLLESELFGYVEGAFTGANKKGKAGYFELAHGGTIFLDEIGEMDKQAQTSLLRVIQERRVMRLGGDKFLPIDVRIIAATNKNLVQLIREGKFREDLFYRINVLTLDLPVIKDRQGDAISIAEYFLQTYNQRFGKKIRLSEQVKTFIANYEWPGNVRQLRNYIERLVITAKGNLASDTDVQVVEPMVLEKVQKKDAFNEDSSERSRLIWALEATGYNQKEAAKRLGIDRSTLYRKLRALNIQVKKDLQHVMH